VAALGLGACASSSRPTSRTTVSTGARASTFPSIVRPPFALSRIRFARLRQRDEPLHSCRAVHTITSL
jgi:hypothetical protein